MIELRLLEYLECSLIEKEKDLECPVCLETATAPIYMCGDMHMICHSCRPRLRQCPECRSEVGYGGDLRRHRYAEKMAEDVGGIRKEIDHILQNLAQLENR